MNEIMSTDKRAYFTKQAFGKLVVVCLSWWTLGQHRFLNVLYATIPVNMFSVP